MSVEGPAYIAALNDFRQARRKAKMRSLFSGLSGKPDALLSYDEVTSRIKVSGLQRRYLDEIQLDAIVGSVGRYQDFTREFLPLTDSGAERWAKVKSAQVEKGLAPIDVYKIGDVYFVLDGNHRVSVARQMGLETIEAYVSEFGANIELKPEDNFNDVIMKAEQALVFSELELGRIFPEIDFEVSVPGRYRELYEHIIVHRYYLGIDQQREVSLEEAVRSWYENVYQPVVRTIRQLGILRDFPGRTETDLYLWLKKHQLKLKEALGYQVDISQTAQDLAQHASPRLVKRISDAWEHFLDLVTPDEFESGPPPGEWRVNVSSPRQDKLFNAILVAVSGEEDNWLALEQTFPIARHENAVVRGLHVVAKTKQADTPRVDQIRERFYRRCREEGVNGEFAVEMGEVARQVVARSAWVDLLVLHLKHPPGNQPFKRMQSGIRTILQRCPRPILLVPSMTTSLEKTLLAFDGSPKAEEALFLSSYLGCCWDTELLVVHAKEGGRSQAEVLDRARDYLQEKNVQAQYFEVDGAADKAILDTAREQGVNLIVMGGYGNRGLVSVALGSTVDQMLREYDRLVLICR